jgi:hypothetical protein
MASSAASVAAPAYFTLIDEVLLAVSGFIGAFSNVV